MWNQEARNANNQGWRGLRRLKMREMSRDLTYKAMMLVKLGYPQEQRASILIVKRDVFSFNWALMLG